MMLRAGLDTGCSSRRVLVGTCRRVATKPSEARWWSVPAKNPCSPLGSVSFHAAAAIGILLVSACAEKPLIVSADTSCEKFRHISATDEQIKVFADNWAVMEPYADQILTHNAVYDAACLKEPK